MKKATTGKTVKISRNLEDSKVSTNLSISSQSLEMDLVIDEKEDIDELADHFFKILCSVNGGGLSIKRVFGAPKPQQLPFLKQMLKNLQIWGLYENATNESNESLLSLKKRRENAIEAIEEAIRNLNASMKEIIHKPSYNHVM